jgi:hypothetical protein
MLILNTGDSVGVGGGGENMLNQDLSMLRLEMIGQLLYAIIDASFALIDKYHRIIRAIGCFVNNTKRTTSVLH